MKRFTAIISLAVMVLSVKAQGLSNLFSQKQADLKYMLAQITALQVYIGYAKKGYAIAQKGLTFIGDLKRGEFDLHNGFFNSLKAVNPSISNYAKVADIVAYQLEIINDFKKANQRLQQSGYFSAAEITYMNSVYSTIADECSKSLSTLTDVITDGSLTMTDDQRIKRIDGIYVDMKDKYAFTQAFTSEAGLLAAQRENELFETDFIKILK